MRKIDLEAEREFENRKALGENIRANQSKYYWATQLPADAHRQQTFNVIQNKTVLEIGCASGKDAGSYVQHARSYVGVDISNESIEIAKALGFPNAEFICADGHNIPKPDSSFDCVIVNSLLHHLDLEVTFQEITRLLHRDGILVFSEPLGTNPLFQLYRRFTPSARTVDERPFTFADLALMQNYFQFSDVQWFGFSSIVSAFIPSAFLRNFFRLSLTKFDRFLSITPLKYLFWRFSGIANVK